MFLIVLLLSSHLNDCQAHALTNGTYPIGEEINEEFPQMPSPKSCAGLSVRKCEAYRPQELKQCKTCGLINTGPTYLVTGGKPVKPPYMYPWMVKVTSGGGCGGAIISENYILTAAHCIKNSSADEITVAFLTEADNITDGYAVEKSIPHPDYDVALLKLKKKISCNIYRNPICLPPSNFHPKENTLFKFTGWGITCENPPKREPPKLLEGEAKLVSDSECKKDFNDTAYCLRGVDNQAACGGDSGGSMFLLRNRAFYTMGVASYIFEGEDENDCKSCEPAEPFVFISIPNVIPWIIKTTNMSAIQQEGF